MYIADIAIQRHKEGGNGRVQAAAVAAPGRSDGGAVNAAALKTAVVPGAVAAASARAARKGRSAPAAHRATQGQPALRDNKASRDRKASRDQPVQPSPREQPARRDRRGRKARKDLPGRASMQPFLTLRQHPDKLRQVRRFP